LLQGFRLGEGGFLIPMTERGQGDSEKDADKKLTMPDIGLGRSSENDDDDGLSDMELSSVYDEDCNDRVISAFRALDSLGGNLAKASVIKHCIIV